MDQIGSLSPEQIKDIAWRTSVDIGWEKLEPQFFVQVKWSREKLLMNPPVLRLKDID